MTYIFSDVINIVSDTVLSDIEIEETMKRLQKGPDPEKVLEYQSNAVLFEIKKEVRESEREKDMDAIYSHITGNGYLDPKIVDLAKEKFSYPNWEIVRFEQGRFSIPNIRFPTIFLKRTVNYE